MVNNTISKYPVYSIVQHVFLGNMLPRLQFPHTVPTWSTSIVGKEKQVEEMLMVENLMSNTFHSNQDIPLHNLLVCLFLSYALNTSMFMI